MYHQLLHTLEATRDKHKGTKTLLKQHARKNHSFREK